MALVTLRGLPFAPIGPTNKVPVRPPIRFCGHRPKYRPPYNLTSNYSSLMLRELLYRACVRSNTRSLVIILSRSTGHSPAGRIASEWEKERKDASESELNFENTKLLVSRRWLTMFRKGSSLISVGILSVQRRTDACAISSLTQGQRAYVAVITARVFWNCASVLREIAAIYSDSTIFLFRRWFRLDQSSRFRILIIDGTFHLLIFWFY